MERSGVDMPLVDEGLELLDDEECQALLATRSVGRVAVTVACLPAIFPVNYVVADGDIYFRTGAGTKLRAAVGGTIVAFEVDHVDDDHRAGWSVQAVGHADEVTHTEVVPPLSPWARGCRDHVVRIRPEMLTGRRIASDAGAGAAEP
jgi:hypothetical protein